MSTIKERREAISNVSMWFIGTEIISLSYKVQAQRRGTSWAALKNGFPLLNETSYAVVNYNCSSERETLVVIPAQDIYIPWHTRLQRGRELVDGHSIKFNDRVHCCITDSYWLGGGGAAGAVVKQNKDGNMEGFIGSIWDSNGGGSSQRMKIMQWRRRRRCTTIQCLSALGCISRLLLLCP